LESLSGGPYTARIGNIAAQSYLLSRESQSKVQEQEAFGWTSTHGTLEGRKP
jgi:hypothetical protein